MAYVQIPGARLAFQNAVRDPHCNPGCIGDHRDSGDLLGSPLLQANASPSILLERYTSGYTMAESFYAASHFVGWQDVVIGDPLYCPYAGKGPAK